MFRKIVSNISFSPALVGQLGFYARRLRKEESTRRVGLIFTALALVVQSFAVFSPPEPANASNPSDMIPGGVTSVSSFLRHYDRNTNNIKDLYTKLGITRSEIAATKYKSVNTKRDSPLTWGLTSRFSSAQGERVYTLYKDNGTSRNFYYKPLRLWDSLPYTIANGSTYKMYVGYSAKFGWFAIQRNCGNLVTQKAPASQAPNYRCDTIKAQKISRLKYRFDVKKTAGSGASYKRSTFTFGDGKKQTVTSTTVEHTYSKAGNYVVTATPAFVVGGKTVSANSSKCKTTISIDAEPTPVAQCDQLSISKIGSLRTLNAKVSTANGASIKNYQYTITRDGAVVYDKTFQSTNTTHSTTFNPSGDGVFKATLTVGTSLGNKTSTSCVGQFTVPPPAKCDLNPDLPADSPECQPCPGDENLWIKDKACAADVIMTKTASNTSQNNVDAITTLAKASDRILYKLTATNKGKDSTSVDFVEQLDDVVEYASIIDNGGGVYDKKEHTLTWPSVRLKSGEQQVRMFTVQLSDTIPAAARGVSDATSYDCKMLNTFGNAVEIDVNCPTPKVIEQTITELPETGPTENILFAGMLLATVTFFYARSRQLRTEVRLVRRSINTGTI